MNSLLIALISWCAVSAGVASTFVQYRRVAVQGVEGVSTATWLLFTLNGGFWIAYGLFGAHSAVIVVSSLLCWPLQGVITFRLAPWRHRRGSSQALALFAATCVAPGLVGGWTWCVYGCGVSMVVLRTPQLRQLLLARDASGVSATSWYFSAGCAALWIIYYAQVDLVAALVATLISGVVSLSIALLATARHRQGARDFVRLEVFAN